MNATQSKFKGFHATTDNGTPCWVMGERTAGDEGVISREPAGTPLYLVKLGVLGGYSGWSGGAYREVHYSGKVGTIAKCKIKRGKAK